MDRLLLLYGTFNAAFRSFQALHKFQRARVLMEEHNSRKAHDHHVNEKEVLSRLDRKDVVPLLQLWTILAFVHIFNAYGEQFLAWIPFYAFAKVVIVAWIIIPQTRGAVIAYEMILAPAIDERIRWLDEHVGPQTRSILLFALVRAQRMVLDSSLQNLSFMELNAIDDMLSKVSRSLAREGYVRRRDESLQALKETIPDEKQRVALLDDILREFDDENLDEDDNAWTELRLENDHEASHGIDVRLRFDSDVDSDEENEFDEFVLPAAGVAGT